VLPDDKIWGNFGSGWEHNKMVDSAEGSGRRRIACLISPHGFGHAARAAGVMEALYAVESQIRFEIFTKVPPLFFKDSLAAPYTYHSVLTDIGLAQKSPLKADLEETLQNLNNFLPFRPSRINHLARQVSALNCDLILCDIAPVGIVVARKVGIPSVLVENFTWDWLYKQYVGLGEKIQNHVAYLQRVFDAADYRIQTEPVCRYRHVDLLTRPVSRNFRTPADGLRKQFEIPSGKKTVLITMGGITEEYSFIKRLRRYPDVCFIILGRFESFELCDNLILLPHPTHGPVFLLATSRDRIFVNPKN
jgi:hypothetical protein